MSTRRGKPNKKKRNSRAHPIQRREKRKSKKERQMDRQMDRLMKKIAGKEEKMKQEEADAEKYGKVKRGRNRAKDWYSK